MFKSQFDLEPDKTREHHDLGPSGAKKEHDIIDKIKTAILKHGNPFAAEGDKLINVITYAYIHDVYVPTILNTDVTGQKLYEDYVSERITTTRFFTRFLFRGLCLTAIVDHRCTTVVPDHSSSFPVNSLSITGPGGDSICRPNECKVSALPLN